jgi:hypothetical protein
VRGASSGGVAFWSRSQWSLRQALPLRIVADCHPRFAAKTSSVDSSLARSWRGFVDEQVPVAFVDERSAELLFRHRVIRLLQDEGLLSDERTERLLR